MVPKTITVIGSLNTDLVTVTPRVPSGGETLTATSFNTGSGGKGANQAVASARLSRPRPRPLPTSSDTAISATSPEITVKMIGAVGADEFGPPLLKGMEADGVDISGVQVVEGQTTGVAVILVEESKGENRILLNPGANYTLQPEDFTSVEALGIPTPDLIIMQLEIPLPTVLQVLKTAKGAGIDVLFNPAPAVQLPLDVYSAITHLVVNESEAAILTGRQIKEVEKEDFDWNLATEELLQRGVKNVIVTLGPRGAFYSHVGRRKGALVPAEKVDEVVDTTAAGDTWVGAYAVNIVRKVGGKDGYVTEHDVRLACRAAGRTVEKQGAQSAIPWADEVDRKT